MANEHVGMVGPGRMGYAMLKHLIKKDFPVTVTDINSENVKRAEAAGAKSVADAAALGKACAFIIIAVGFDDEALSVALGTNGLLSTMKPGGVIAVCSTVAPETVQRIEAVSEVHSISGQYDLLMKFYLDDQADIGRFINSQVQTLDGVKDTFTLIAFKAFT